MPTRFRGLAVSCKDIPTLTVDTLGRTLITAISLNTAIATTPSFPSLAATTDVVPRLIAVTKPPVTEATAEFCDDQTIFRPTSVPPFASLGVAVNCCVSPTESMTDDGLTAMYAVVIGVIGAVPPSPHATAASAARSATTNLRLVIGLLGAAVGA